MIKPGTPHNTWNSSVYFHPNVRTDGWDGMTGDNRATEMECNGLGYSLEELGFREIGEKDGGKGKEKEKEKEQEQEQGKGKDKVKKGKEK